MPVSNAQMNWSHTRAGGPPCFVTDTVVCIPSKNLVSFSDVDGTRLGSRPFPDVQCVAALASRGVVAIGCKFGVTLLSYPDLRAVSTLGQCEGGCKALLFVLQDHLVVVMETGAVELWEWKTRRRAWRLSELLPQEELKACCQLSMNPGGQDEVCLQTRSRFLFVGTDARSRSVFLYQSEDGSLKAECKLEQGYLDLSCHCWLQEKEDCVLVYTSTGFLKLDTDGLHVWGMTLPPHHSPITSLTLNGDALYVGREDGIVDVDDIIGLTSLKHIDVGGPVCYISSSHHSDWILFTTSSGSVSSYRGDSLNRIVAADSSQTIGVGLTDRQCAVARKDGTVTVLKTDDGSELGSADLHEELACAASSPLCPLLALGCRSGFVIFVDVEGGPRVVHCTKVDEVPVSLLQFDRFGRFLMSSSRNNTVHIHSGLPSKRFQFLGSVQVPKDVKGMAVHERGTTSLLLLSESGLGSEQGAGNVLYRVDRRLDSCSDKYFSDDLGNLRLELQTFRLSHPSTSLNVHSNLGVLFHSPIVGQVQRLPVNFASPKQTNLFKAEQVSIMKVSPSERWLATVDYSGLIRIYRTCDFKTPVFVQGLLFENGVRFLEFSPWDDTMLMTDERGNVACFKWENDPLFDKGVAEWTYFCHSNFDAENQALKGMSEEDISTQRSSLTLEELGHEFDRHLDVVNFELIRLPTESLQEGSCSLSVADDDSLKTLSDSNLRIFLECGGQKCDVCATRNGDIEAKSINSPSGIFVRSYPCVPQAKEVVSKASRNGHSHFRSNGIKMENKTLRLEFVKDIMNEIRDWKVGFNASFNVLRNKHTGFEDRVSDMSHKLKVLTSNLPSKGERDLWSALCRVRNPQSKTTDRDSDTVSDTKRAIETLSESIDSVERDFDSDVERLRLKKVLCDYSVHTRELKALCVLLYALTEQEVTQQTNEGQQELNNLDGGIFERVLVEVRDLEREYDSWFTRVQKLQRELDFKVRTKLNKFGDRAKGVYGAYKAPVTEPSTDMSEDTDQKEPIPAFHTDELNAAWKSISKYRPRRIKSENVSRQVQSQTLELTKIRIRCEAGKAKATAKRRLLVRVLDGSEKLLAKLKETFLFTVNLLTSEDRSDRGIEETLRSDDPFWDEVRRGAGINAVVGDRLLKLEKSLRNLFQFQVRMLSRLSDIEEGHMEECERRLRGAKGAFSDMSGVVSKIMN